MALTQSLSKSIASQGMYIHDAPQIEDKKAETRRLGTLIYTKSNGSNWLVNWGNRFLGSFSAESGVMFIKRNKSHIYRTLNAWCINASLLQNKGIRYIVLLTDNSRYSISRETILAKGEEIEFSSRGYELQIALPMDLWTKER